jgi:para-aminobenzoate synthetase component 1
MVEKQISEQVEWVKGQMNTLAQEARPFVFILDYAMQSPLVFPLDEIDSDQIRYDINGHTNHPESDVSVGGPVELYKNPVPFDTYKVAFDTVMEELHYGNSFLSNLTFPTAIRINLTLSEVFAQSKAKYKLYVSDQFVLFSPETFVQISDARISAFPMKGTIDAGLSDARKRILEDPKEKAEHITIVDLLRNDLSQIASDVRVDRFRFIEEVRTHDKTLLQVSSEISGDLSANWKSRIGDLIFALLPAGSISGAPKRKTVEILARAESGARGYFTGVTGIFDGEKVDSGVMIRFIEKQGDQLYFRSGGGITTQSRAEDEYQEMIDKVYVPVY